jgi:DNA-binding MarR family transcriptional regulator
MNAVASATWRQGDPRGGSARSGFASWQRGQLGETGNPGIVLSVLTSIERDSAITQRALARELGIALGLANTYLRRCVRKGLVKMRQVPINRYAYYLTPQGLTEKSRLTAEYLAVSFDFFRRARTDCATLFRQCEVRGWQTVALYGAGDLAEIAVLSAGETTVKVICIIDSEHLGRRCGGVAIVPDLSTALSRAGVRGLDGIVVTDTRAPQASFDNLLMAVERKNLPASCVIAPSLLRISPVQASATEEAYHD